MKHPSKIKRLRESRGLSIEELANIFNIGDLALQYFEEGNFNMLTIPTLIKIAQYFGVTTDYILDL